MVNIRMFAYFRSVSLTLFHIKVYIYHLNQKFPSVYNVIKYTIHFFASPWTTEQRSMIRQKYEKDELHGSFLTNKCDKYKVSVLFWHCKTDIYMLKFMLIYVCSAHKLTNVKTLLTCKQSLYEQKWNTVESRKNDCFVKTEGSVANKHLTKTYMYRHCCKAITIDSCLIFTLEKFCIISLHHNIRILYVWLYKFFWDLSLLQGK